jgi:hypothetical protein
MNNGDIKEVGWLQKQECTISLATLRTEMNILTLISQYNPHRKLITTARKVRTIYKYLYID